MIQHRLSDTNPPTQTSDGMPNENSKNHPRKHKKCNEICKCEKFFVTLHDKDFGNNVNNQFIRIHIAYRMAKNRHRDPLGWVLLSLFVSPVLTWIILLIAGNASSAQQK